jgi:hypothetical protein
MSAPPLSAPRVARATASPGALLAMIDSVGASEGSPREGSDSPTVVGSLAVVRQSSEPEPRATASPATLLAMIQSMEATPDHQLAPAQPGTPGAGDSGSGSDPLIGPVVLDTPAGSVGRASTASGTASPATLMALVEAASQAEEDALVAVQGPQVLEDFGSLGFPRAPRDTASPGSLLSLLDGSQPLDQESRVGVESGHGGGQSPQEGASAAPILLSSALAPVAGGAVAATEGALDQPGGDDTSSPSFFTALRVDTTVHRARFSTDVQEDLPKSPAAPSHRHRTPSKSCLSATKKSSAKKNVVFGSPEVCNLTELAEGWFGALYGWCVCACAPPLYTMY